MDFDALKSLLEGAGYDVRVVKPWRADGSLNDNYRFARVGGKNIKAGFCEPNNNESYLAINGKIAADHISRFSYWNKCPLNLPFPQDDAQASRLVELLERLGRAAEFEDSIAFTYLNITTEGTAMPDNSVQACYNLRNQGYLPYCLCIYKEQEKEIISYPYPDGDGISIMIRDENRPTTIRAVKLDEIKLR